MKRIAVTAGLIVILSACGTSLGTEKIFFSTPNDVTVTGVLYTPGSVEAATQLAQAHCQKYGKNALLQPGGRDGLEHFNCVLGQDL